MRFTVAREIFSGWSLVIVVLLPHNSLRAQPNRPVAVTTVAQLLALCNDPKTIVDTTKVNQVLKSLGRKILRTRRGNWSCVQTRKSQLWRPTAG